MAHVSSLPQIPLDKTGALTIDGSDDDKTHSAPEDGDESSDGLSMADEDEEEEIAPALSAGLFDSHAIKMSDDPPPSSSANNSSDRDVGDYADEIQQAPDPTGNELQSNKQSFLRSMKDCLGSRQVTASQLTFAPSWILDEAIEEELSQNWEGAYETVEATSLPPDANVIASHRMSYLKLRTTLMVHCD